MSSSLRLAVRSDGVAVCTIDVPGSTVNLISTDLLHEIEPLLSQVENDRSVRAVVMTSGKRDSFVAGGDLDEIRRMTTPEAGEAFARRGHELLDRIAASPKPFVAAIHGAAVGGGLEIALACRARIATDHPRTVLALPEVMVGLLPGGGGTQRLPRLIGLEKSLPMLLSAKRIRARKALHYGLLDAIANHDLVEEAASLALAFATSSEPPRASHSLRRRVVELGPLRSIVLRRAREEVMRRTRGQYPAPLFILDCVETGLSHGFEAGREREIRLFGRLVAGVESKKLIWLFDASTALKKSPAGEPRQVRRIAILGAGLMGQGIASVSLPHADVVLKDVERHTLQNAVRGIQRSIDNRLGSGAVSAVEAEEQRGSLHATENFAELAGADLVIEAVFEEIELKRRVLAETEAVIGEEAVYASNTSAIPIGEIAAAAAHPERVVGMHYFSPVPKMPLLEVVRGAKSASWAVATAQAFGMAQGKTVIVVNDGPGFYTTRILAPYMNEAVLLAEQGASFDQIDATMKDFGFPLGPIALLDEVGIDVAAHVSRDLGRAFAMRGFTPSAKLAELAAAGFAGRKNDRGFYLSDAKRRGKRRINPDAAAHFAHARSDEIFPDAIMKRLVLLMVNEAAHALSDGVLGSPRDGDIGAVLGLGFPAFRGGPFHYVDDRGAASVIEDLERLAVEHGQRFEPVALLRDQARRGERFFD
ncbi:MAG TPA: 3-hydroxyacyl-CoA dehydrogenase NAD-binding domain-containing protein [Thermoanaerobaculia bacterium]